MTLEQFKAMVKECSKALPEPVTKGDICHRVFMLNEIAMNAMDVLKAVGESGYREGCEDTINELSSSLLPGAIRRATKHKWLDSDTKKRLDNE